VRLLPGDALLLKERATARPTVPAAYVSILLRSHLRQLSPLPTDELRVIREQIRELRNIGRNLNQIARGMNRGEVDDPTVREDLRMFVKVATAMREATRALLKANTKAWEVGACAGVTSTVIGACRRFGLLTCSRPSRGRWTTGSLAARAVRQSGMRRCVQQRSLRYVLRQSRNISKAFAQGRNSGLPRVWCG
jgi:hypothetical protein